jgi:hypothetical protein
VVAVRVYVEGGGDTKAQRGPLRIALKQWLEEAIPGAPAITVVACGGRSSAFEDFAEAVKDHPDAFCILLVDSEAPVATADRWRHVKDRQGDGWAPPRGVGEDNLHFMAQTMETWLCADPDALAEFFGPGFARSKLPQRKDLEDEPKADVAAKLAAASAPSHRGPYHKGRDLALLGRVSPTRVQDRCPHAKSFVGAVASNLAR